MQEDWLLELHGKFWKQESLRFTLFHTVEITRAHYSELQTRLNVAQPTRHSNTYKTEGVMSIKLDILQKIVPDQSSASGVDCSNVDGRHSPMARR